MRVGFDRSEIVDADHHDVAPLRFDDRAQNQPPDAAEPIDGDACAHHLLRTGQAGPALMHLAAPQGKGLGLIDGVTRASRGEAFR